MGDRTLFSPLVPLGASMLLALVVGCGGGDSKDPVPSNTGCLQDSECPEAYYCFVQVAGTKGACAPGCRVEPDTCTEGKVCNPQRHVCETPEAPCEGPEDCGEKQICNQDSGECEDVTCTNDSHCAALERCNLDTYTCESKPPVCDPEATEGALRCPLGSYCTTENSPLGECIEGCDTYEDCPAERPVCSDDHRCLVCDDCPDPCSADPAAPLMERCPNDYYCDALTHLCVETCGGDGECAENEICCTEDICSQRTCVPRCQDEGIYECPEGWFCEANGHCSPGCTEDQDCGRSELICWQQECRVGCRADDACAEGAYCNLAAEPPICERGCRTDAECPGQICREDHTCGPVPCQIDDVCPEGQYCNLGLNICSDGCRTDAECEDGQICNVQHSCEAGCVADDECGQDEICVDGTGRCARGCRDDALEPNDGRDEAEALVFGEDGTLEFSEQVLCSGNLDWYSVEVPELHTLVVTVFYEQEAGNIAIELQDAEGVALDRSLEVGAGRQTVEYDQAEGTSTVYLRVWGINLPNARAVPYRLTAQLAPTTVCRPDGLEPNETWQSAPEVADGLQEDLRLCDGDTDWLRFPLGMRDRLVATVAFDPAGPPLRVELYSQGELEPSLLAVGVEPEGEPGRRRVELAEVFQPGRYYLKITGAGAGEAGIAYTVDLAPERWVNSCENDAWEGETGNDTRFTATDLEGTNYDAEWTDNMICMGDQDWYAVRVQTGDTLWAEVDHDLEVGDLTLEVYRGGALLQRSASHRSPERILLEDLDGDTYYLRVVGVNDSEAPYTLRVRVQLWNCAPDFYEPNDSIDDPTTVNCGDSLLRLVSCFEDSDYYELTTFRFGAVSGTASYLQEVGDLEVEILDGLGEVLVSEGVWDAETSSRTTEVHQQEPGVFLFHVYNVAGHPNRYEFRVACTQEDPLCTPDAFEPNQDHGSASVVVLPRDTGLPRIFNDLRLCGGDDEDWFQFRVRPGDQLDILAEFFHFRGDIDLELYCYGEWDVPVAVSDSTNDDENIVWEAPQDGTCMLRVFGEAQRDEGADYELSFQPL